MMRPALRMMVVASVLAIAGPTPAQTLEQKLQVGRTLVGQNQSVSPDAGIPITSIEVFANSAMLIKPPSQKSWPVTVYRVDAIANMDQELSQGLPKTEREAMAVMLARKDEVQRRYSTLVNGAARGITLGVQYGIERLPAIVVNRQAIVYGVLSIDEAVGHFRSSRAVRAPASKGRP